MRDPFEKRVEDELAEKLDQHVEKGIWGSYTAKMNRASELGFNCDTFHDLTRQHGELRPRISVDLAKIFRCGNVWETPNIRLVQDAGIEVKDRIGMYEWPQYQIRGKLDAEIFIPDLHLKCDIPFEHKTCSPNSFRAIKAHRDDGVPLTKSKYIWLRKYPGQLIIYMLMKGVEWGLWMFFEKVTGSYFFWLLKLDYEYGEELIQRAERANKNAAAGTVTKPAYKEECNKCDYQMTYCFPDKDFGPGFDMITDPSTEEKIERYSELEAMHKEFGSLKKDIFGDKKKPGFLYGRNAIVGDYKIENKKNRVVVLQCA